MPFIKNTITNAGAFATAFLGATIAAHAGVSSEVVNSYPLAAPILVVLSNVLSNISSECINPLKEEILEQLKNKHPNQLNHDIQKALIKSMEEAVKGIKILYDDKNPNHRLSSEAKKFLKNFNEEFIKNFSSSSGYIIKEDELKNILHADNKNQDELFIQKQLNECLEKELKTQVINVELKNLFTEKFIPLTQFYFGEELKHSKNPAPRRAMERMLSEETLAGINKLIALQEKSEKEIKSQKWLGKVGKLSPKKIEELKSIVNDLNKPQKLAIEYGEALDKRFEDLYIQYKDLQFDINKINTILGGIHKILNRYLIVASILVIASAITVSAIVTKSKLEPFDSTIALQCNNCPDKLSLKFGKLTISNKEHISKVDINSQGLAKFEQLPSKVDGSKFNIKLSEIDNQPFSLKCETCNVILKNNSVSIIELKVKGLDYYRGYVKNEGGEGIVGAIIHIQSLTDSTKENGRFDFYIPPSYQHMYQDILITANGYQNSTFYRVPINTSDEAQIQLKTK